MNTFSNITIIYNTKSTGDSQAMAEKLQIQLQKSLPGLAIDLIPTERAGHARELARQAARASERPLIISSSGDGGYNEVINGVMDAANPNAICAVLPAGNANDHSRTMHEQPLAKAIVEGNTSQIDLIKVTVQAAGDITSRYAHSYVGLGLTPVVAVELNSHSLNAFREIILALKTFRKYRPFKIHHNDAILRLDSLLFGNINQMAKVLTLAPENRPDDGKFEVVIFPASHKWGLVKRLAKAATTKLDTPKRCQEYHFTVIKKMPIQLDGEVMSLLAGSEVAIEAVHKTLTTIV